MADGLAPNCSRVPTPAAKLSSISIYRIACMPLRQHPYLERWQSTHDPFFFFFPLLICSNNLLMASSFFPPPHSYVYTVTAIDVWQLLQTGQHEASFLFCFSSTGLCVYNIRWPWPVYQQSLENPTGIHQPGSTVNFWGFVFSRRSLRGSIYIPARP
jgi:hypothetical protein